LEHPEKVEAVIGPAPLELPTLLMSKKSMPTKKGIESMENFAAMYGKSLKTSEVKPDIFLDLIANSRHGLNHVLYYLSNGDPEVIRQNQSLREAIMVYILANLQNRSFWERRDYLYINTLSAEEKYIIVPKLFDNFDAAEYVGDKYNDLFKLTLVGTNDKEYALLRPMFDKYGKIYNLKPVLSDKFAEHHSKTKYIFHRGFSGPTDVVKADFVSTGDGEPYFTAPRDLLWNHHTHVNMRQLPPQIKAELEKEWQESDK